MIYLLGLILLLSLAIIAALLIRGGESAIKLESTATSMSEAATYEIID